MPSPTTWTSLAIATNTTAWSSPEVIPVEKPWTTIRYMTRLFHPAAGIGMSRWSIDIEGGCGCEGTQMKNCFGGPHSASKCNTCIDAYLTVQKNADNYAKQMRLQLENEIWKAIRQVVTAYKPSSWECTQKGSKMLQVHPVPTLKPPLGSGQTPAGQEHLPRLSPSAAAEAVEPLELEGADRPRCKGRIWTCRSDLHVT